MSPATLLSPRDVAFARAVREDGLLERLQARPRPPPALASRPLRPSRASAHRVHHPAVRRSAAATSPRSTDSPTPRWIRRSSTSSSTSACRLRSRRRRTIRRRAPGPAGRPRTCSRRRGIAPLRPCLGGSRRLRAVWRRARSVGCRRWRRSKASGAGAAATTPARSPTSTHQIRERPPTTPRGRSGRRAARRRCGRGVGLRTIRRRRTRRPRSMCGRVPSGRVTTAAPTPTPRARRGGPPSRRLAMRPSGIPSWTSGGTRCREPRSACIRMGGAATASASGPASRTSAHRTTVLRTTHAVQSQLVNATTTGSVRLAVSDEWTCPTSPPDCVYSAETGGGYVFSSNLADGVVGSAERDDATVGGNSGNVKGGSYNAQGTDWSLKNFGNLEIGFWTKLVVGCAAAATATTSRARSCAHPPPAVPPAAPAGASMPGRTTSTCTSTRSCS